MPRLYLDMCALKRPYDRQDDQRLLVESLAVDSIISAWEARALDIVSSAILELENSKNPNPERRDEVAELLRRFERTSTFKPQSGERARYLVELGMAPLDALHVASSESAKCDYFVTCDDALLTKAKQMQEHLRVRIVDPLEMVRILKRGELP